MKGSPNLYRVLQMHSLITFTSKFTKLSKELENNSLLTGIREKWAWRAHQDVFRILLTPQNYKEHHSLLAARSYFPWELQHNHKMSLQTSDSQQQWWELKGRRPGCQGHCTPSSRHEPRLQWQWVQCWQSTQELILCSKWFEPMNNIFLPAFSPLSEGSPSN